MLTMYSTQVYNSIVHLCVCACVCQSVRGKKKKKKKGGSQVIRAVQGVNTHSQDIEKTSSVGDQLRDPKLPPYGSLYRSIATDH